MITESDLIMVALAFLIGFIDDYYKPKAYHYKNQVVIVYEKYQCPTYCGVDHNHYVYFEGESIGMVIDKNQLGKRYKEKKVSNKK